ncbi:MAG: carbohydrate kinase family protein [Candidatus Bathyarchaeia archaeon]
MPVYITFLGHVSMDTVQNVNGTNVQPGGAALYAAVAAKTLTEDVALASVIGRDFKFIDVLKSFVHLHVKISALSSTKFVIRYDNRWEAHFLQEEYGAGKKISFDLLPKRVLKQNCIVHISPLPPLRVQKIISKIRSVSPKTKISVNSWIGYMKSQRNCRILREIAQETDYFIINDSEAKALTESDSLSIALRVLKAKMLVVTLGEFGAIVNTNKGDVQMVPALRFPVEKIIDTTGAGDTWCGAFLAAYQLTGDIVKAVTAASVISSIKCTGWGFSRLFGLKFKDVDSIIDYVIGLREGKMQKRLSEYS